MEPDCASGVPAATRCQNESRCPRETSSGEATATLTSTVGGPCMNRREVHGRRWVPRLSIIERSNALYAPHCPPVASCDVCSTRASMLPPLLRRTAPVRRRRSRDRWSVAVGAADRGWNAGAPTIGPVVRRAISRRSGVCLIHVPGARTTEDACFASTSITFAAVFATDAPACVDDGDCRRLLRWD